MKNSHDTTGNRAHDLPTCSAVPQPNAPPRAPTRPSIITTIIVRVQGVALTQHKILTTNNCSIIIIVITTIIVVGLVLVATAVQEKCTTFIPTIEAYHFHCCLPEGRWRCYRSTKRTDRLLRDNAVTSQNMWGSNSRAAEERSVLGCDDLSVGDCISRSQARQ